jgi:hypothetical protein
MTGEARGGVGWLRKGCLGCAAVLVLLLVGGQVLVSLGREAARSQKITKRSVEEPLAAPGLDPGAAASEPAGVVPDAPRLALPDYDAEAGAAGGDPGSRAGRVLIDLRHGEFHVEPAPPGEPLRVEAEFDENRYELITEMAEVDGAWHYTVRFWQAGAPGLVSLFARMMGAREPRVTVYLPREVPMGLDLRFSQGGGEIDLGGLWLTEARVAFEQGGGELDFSEPLREPTERLGIDASMGGGSFRRLGNASPRVLNVETQMGGGEVDLGGKWLRDCEISLEASMGGMAVGLPDHVNTRGLPQDRSAPTSPGGEPAPTLTFSYSSSMGEIDFQR